LKGHTCSLSIEIVTVWQVFWRPAR